MNERRIIAYSFLAHINNSFSSKSIKDLNEVFLPLIKRVISKLYQDGVVSGLIKDIKENVDKSYALDIPYPLLIKMVKKIANEANRNGDNLFAFHDDHSFMIKKYTFSEYEEFIMKQDSEINLIASAYDKYLRSQNINPSTQPTIFDFLDKNRISLSNFFANRELVFTDSTNFQQANFINLVKNRLFSICRMLKIYIPEARSLISMIIITSVT